MTTPNSLTIIKPNNATNDDAKIDAAKGQLIIEEIYQISAEIHLETLGGASDEVTLGDGANGRFSSVKANHFGKPGDPRVENYRYATFGFEL